MMMMIMVMIKIRGALIRHYPIIGWLIIGT